MNWIKNLRLIIHLPKVTGAIPKCSLPYCSMVSKQQNGILPVDRTSLFNQAGSVSKKQLSWRFYGLYGSEANYCWSRHNSTTTPRRFEHAIHSGPELSRDFLVKLWVADSKMKKVRHKQKRIVEHADNGEKPFVTKDLHESYFSGSSLNEEGPYDSSQRVIEPVKHASQEEALVALATLLSRSNLLITRDIEWANLTLGFEQENRYAIVDVSNPHEPAGFIREESNVIIRQLLRLRRPFVASITDGYGNELFRVRRPFWWITSSIYAEVGGKEIGVVHRRWHLWKRIYDLYLGNEQFALVENPGFWNWTFTLKGINGEVLAEIDRDWRGFGFEIFTDAGQYVIRFGSADHEPMSGPAGHVQELEVARQLSLAERAVAVALAVSLDNDYFSRHGGWGLPFIAVGE